MGSDAGREPRCIACGRTLSEIDERFCSDCLPTELESGERSRRDAPGEEADPLLGATVGLYRIEALVGQGGMGQVYRALHTRLDRVVALKVLPRERLADPDRRRRFLREAKSASSLAHPNIVTVHDLIEEGSRDFLVMEYVAGPTLADVIPGGGLPLGQALRYARQIAAGLSAAHRAGIVHRDVKPGNVMIAAGDVAKLVDFGLAKLTDAEAGETEAATFTRPTRTQLTRQGARVGTANYMSPEQALGGSVDQRSDIFSLGAVLYEMLTGRRPFAGPSRVAVLHNVVYKEPRPLSRLAPGTPRELRRAISKALAKKPEDRYSSMAELEPVLDALAQSEETGAGSRESSVLVPASRAVTRLWRRQRAVLIAAGLLIGLLIVLLPRARERAGKTPGDRAMATSPATPFELFRLGEARLERVDRPGSLDQAIEAFEAAIAGDGLHAPSHAGLAAAFLEKYINENKDAEWLKRALAAGRRAVELDPHLAAAHARLGLVMAEAGDAGAREELERALGLDPSSADAHLGLAKLAGLDGRPAEVESELRRAIESAPDRWRLHSELGVFYFGQARYEAARAAFERVLELTPDNFIGFQSLAAVLHMQGDNEAAAATLQRALEIRGDANVYSNLGTLFYFDARYREAAAAFERAVELKPNLHLFWANLGDAYRWIPGSEAEARQSFDRAVQLVREELATTPESTPLRAALAEYLAKAGQPARALAEVEAMADEEKSPATWFRLVKAYELAGEREQALGALAEALAGGYSIEEVRGEPELIELRRDVRYHRLVLEYEEPVR